jgi:hypothetical protein
MCHVAPLQKIFIMRPLSQLASETTYSVAQPPHRAFRCDAGYRPAMQGAESPAANRDNRLQVFGAAHRPRLRHQACGYAGSQGRPLKAARVMRLSCGLAQSE